MGAKPPTQNSAFPKGPSRLSGVFSNFDSPHPNPRFPPAVPLACWVVIRVFTIILLMLEHKIKWFLLIFWVFSGETDADLLARITVKSQQRIQVDCFS